VRESVSRLRHRVHIWDVVNEPHVQPETGRGMTGYTREQNVDLTVAALRAAREMDPTCFRIVNVTGTWADYYMSDKPAAWQHSPYDYFNMLRDAKADFETIGLQYYHSGRCLVECERDIESFQDFGKPIHITEMGFPSTVELDPQFHYGSGGAYWGGGPGGSHMVWHGDEFSEATRPSGPSSSIRWPTVTPGCRRSPGGTWPIRGLPSATALWFGATALPRKATSASKPSSPSGAKPKVGGECV